MNCAFEVTRSIADYAESMSNANLTSNNCMVGKTKLLISIQYQTEGLKLSKISTVLYIVLQIKNSNNNETN